MVYYFNLHSYIQIKKYTSSTRTIVFSLHRLKYMYLSILIACLEHDLLCIESILPSTNKILAKYGQLSYKISSN